MALFYMALEESEDGGQVITEGERPEKEREGAKGMNIQIEIYEESNGLFGYTIIAGKDRYNLSGFASKLGVACAVSLRVKEIIEKGEK